MKTLDLITTTECFHKSGHCVPMEQHNHYEIVYYHRGQGISKIGDKNISFSPGTFVIMPPNVWHDERHFADGDLYFFRVQSDSRLQTGVFQDDQHEFYLLSKAIYQEAVDQKAHYKDMIYMKLNEFFIRLERFTSAPGSPAIAKSFEYVINYISESYYSKIHFADLASQFHFSYDYFQHHFKELTGYSPQNYLIKKRVEAAEEMLLTSQLSCTEIAYRCGFSNSAQFSSIFKRERGITPNNYRKN